MFTLRWTATTLTIGALSFILLQDQTQVPEDQLSPKVSEWLKQGNFVNIFGHDMYYRLAGNLQETEKVVVFFHGFPTSSYDYHRALEHLLKDFPGFKLVFFDHIGFGFSDKPKENYEYTIHDHAENALELLTRLDIKSAHIVAHDMGDSVLTEILLRRHLNQLPQHFDTFFKSVTFTNGGMVYHLINFRLSQRILILPYVGQLATYLTSRILPHWLSHAISRRQLSTLWGDNVDNMEEDIEAIVSLMRWKGGQELTYKTGSYLKDRARFESRWFRALSSGLGLPTLLLWADSDAVSPIDIPKYLAMNVFQPGSITGKYIRKTGHFLMLEQPETWSKIISDFILQHEKSL